MKRIMAVSFVALFFVAGVANAQTQEAPTPRLLPDSPFYFLKAISENIGTLFSVSDEAKAERLSELAERRLAEARALAEKGKGELAERLTERYQERLDGAMERLDRAAEQGVDVEAARARITEAALRHQEVLERVRDRVPEEARATIERVLERSVEQAKVRLENLSDEDRAEIEARLEVRREEVKERLDELKERTDIATSTKVRVIEEIKQRILPGEPRLDSREPAEAERARLEERRKAEILKPVRPTDALRRVETKTEVETSVDASE